MHRDLMRTQKPLKQSAKLKSLKPLAATFGCACILCFMSSWSLFHAHTPPEKEAGQPTKPQETALGAYQKQAARDFLKQQAPDIDLSSDAGKKRLELIIDKYVNDGAFEDLILLYEYFPESFEYKELASIALGKALLAANQNDAYYQIRRNWQGHEREPEEWFFLDAEALINQGKLDDAAALLTSRSFKNEAETDRLVRLALLHLMENPKLSWKYLSEASLRAPEDPIFNIYKASLLESANKLEPALAEYVSAIQKDPDNPRLREYLADFYLRTGQHHAAIKILEDSLASPSLDSIWLKTMFWSRVITPVNYRDIPADVPKGALEPLVKYMMALPPGIFWNAESIAALTDNADFLANRQETFWLRLLAELKKGNEDAAAILLQQNPFQATSWMPQQEKILKAVIAYRKTQLTNHTAAAPWLPSSNTYPANEGALQFLDTLETYSNGPLSQAANLDLPKNLQEILLSQEVFSILFLASGWDEAALQLHSLATIPASFPNWISYRLAEAIHTNRNAQQALQFILNQPQTPELALMTAELFLEAKQPDAAIEKLKTVYKNDSLIGQKAAALLSKIYLDQGDANAAKETILSQPGLVNDIPSKEILARIALQNGELNTANALYLSLENQSSEAKSFLARKAFADREWQRAKKLTEELAKEFPDNTVLKDNLLKIALEEQKESSKKH